MARKFSGFTNGLTNQSPTDTLVGLDISLSAANQNSYWTLNSLFSVITRNITDGALRFGGFAAPSVSAVGGGAIYFDSGSNTFKISQNGGAYANLLSGTVTVSQGGTGLTTLTAYALMAAGTTATGNMQQVSGVGASGQVLTSNGTGALPTWQTLGAGTIGGTIANTQVAVGSGANTIAGSSALTFTSGVLATTGNISLVTTTSTSTGVIYKGATPFFHNFNPPNADGGNVFIGGAGNFTMAWDGVNSYTAARNILIGGGVGALITTGYFNSIVGYESGKELTSGAGNAVLGARALFATTTAHDNAAIGDNALYSNTTGEFNQAVGYQSLYQMTIGDGNAALGRQAGYGLLDGDYNTFIGYAATVTTTISGLTNSTAIGANATVTKSNQMVLGASDVTETLLYGQIICDGQIFANNAGGNIRLKGANTSAGDGAIAATGAGVIYFSNWSLNRGWQINADASIQQLGTSYCRFNNIGLGTGTFGTSATSTLAMATGTAPSTSPADSFQIYSADINGTAGSAGAHLRNEVNTAALILPGVRYKTDTGDPTDTFEGMMVINTFDNTFKVYADSAWRTITTW